jgi:hypothetical protein
MQRDLSDDKKQIDLSDKKIFELVQRSDTTPIKEEENNKPEVKVQVQEIIVIDSCKREGSLTKFIKRLIIFILCIILIYLTIFRYALGYKFFKNKDYKKGAAVLSPELLTISALLL